MGTVDSASLDSDDPPVEAEVKRLEDDLSVLKTDVAVIRSNYVTKEELHKELHAMTWKIIGTFAVLCGAVFWIARNVAPPQVQLSAPVASSAAAPASASPPATGTQHDQGKIASFVPA